MAADCLQQAIHEYISYCMLMCIFLTGPLLCYDAINADWLRTEACGRTCFVVTDRLDLIRGEAAPLRSSACIQDMNAQ